MVVKRASRMQCETCSALPVSRGCDADNLVVGECDAAWCMLAIVFLLVAGSIKKSSSRNNGWQQRDPASSDEREIFEDTIQPTGGMGETRYPKLIAK